MRIGMIGLGNMGAPMARNLLTAGHAVVGFDTQTRPKDIPHGASACDTVNGAEVVITMLPNGAILRDVTTQILSALAPDTILLDCSTVDVASTRAVAAQAETVGCAAVDAPVSGGISGAQAGTLTFMVGGPKGAFDRVTPLFEVMGQRAVHCGMAGAGQAAKICNNMILGATMIATCEAFALADKLGLDRQALFDVVSTSSGASWSMNSYCPAPGIGPQSPADRDYEPGFAANLMLKDLRLAQNAAQEVDANTPIGAQAKALYEVFAEQEGNGALDFSALLPWFAARGQN